MFVATHSSGQNSRASCAIHVVMHVDVYVFPYYIYISYYTIPYCLNMHYVGIAYVVVLVLYAILDSVFYPRWSRDLGSLWPSGPAQGHGRS